MKLLLDENVPVKLKYRIHERGIAVFTVADQKWNSKKNGELLALMTEEKFTHLLTFDTNLLFQQNFLSYPIPVVVIIASSNTYSVIMEVFEEIISALETTAAGAKMVIHPSGKK